MRRAIARWVLGAAALLGALGHPDAAPAVEYKLLVASTFEQSFTSFLKAGDLQQGKASPGLARLEADLDAGRLDAGAMLFDRRVQPVRESIGRAYGGARVVPRLRPGGEPGGPFWDEVTWEGTPGEHSVWLVAPLLRQIQELYNLALSGSGPLRYFQPYTVPMNNGRMTGLLVPLNYLWFHEERGNVWNKYLAKNLDLEQGIGVVTGVNTNAQFPDQAYLIVKHAEAPTTYKAVLVWRPRGLDREAPSKTPIPK